MIVMEKSMRDAPSVNLSMRSVEIRWITIVMERSTRDAPSVNLSESSATG
jgi:hypothetical protein